jgi:hypothetical protein
MKRTMTGKQRNRLAVQKAVAEVLDKHQAKWQGVAELRSRYEQLTGNLIKIGEYENRLKKKLAPLKEKMLNSRRVLVEQLFPISSVLSVYAYDTGDKKLRRLAAVKFSDLEKASDELMMKYCGKILKITDSLLAQKKGGEKKTPKQTIADYGLTSGHLDKIRDALDKWKRDLSAYSTTRKEKKRSKAKLDRRIRENSILLKSKIDKMIHLFRESQKTFYDAYIKARIPSDKGPDTKAKSVSPKKKETAAEKKAEPAVASGESTASGNGK